MASGISHCKMQIKTTFLEYKCKKIVKIPRRQSSLSFTLLTGGYRAVVLRSHWAAPGAVERAPPGGLAQETKSLPAGAQDKRPPGSTPGQADPLEEGAAARPSTPAWEVPRTEEPAGCGPRGHKVSHG